MFKREEDNNVVFRKFNSNIFLKGELKMTSAMEELCEALFLDQVPDPWTARAYSSTFGLTTWYADLLLRIKEVETWVADFQVSRQNKCRRLQHD